MKLVYLIPSTFNSGGMERILCDKTNGILERGEFEIHIITTDQDNKDNFFNFNPLIIFHDLEVNYSEYSQNTSVIKKTIMFRSKQALHKQRLNKLLLKLDADITISMYSQELMFLDKLTDRSKKIVEIHFSKYFKQAHNNALGRQKSHIMSLLNKIRLKKEINILKRVDKFVVLTNEDLSLWHELNNTICIPNFLSYTNNEIENPDYSAKRAISVGRLEEQKGYDMLINTWKIVHEKYPEWKLSIFGNGYLKDKLQKQINNLGLSSAITLEGTTLHISQEYSKSSMYIMSSRNEGLPLVLLEAMIHKLPCVSFACQCGPRDLIDHNKSGFLVENVGDTNSLGKYIIKLIEDENLRKRIGANAFEKSKSFSKSIIIDQWVNLFNNLLIR